MKIVVMFNEDQLKAVVLARDCNSVIPGAEAEVTASLRSAWSA